jgi:hypothetical protein
MTTKTKSTQPEQGQPCRNALRILNDLAFQDYVHKHPTIPPELIPRPTYKDSKANNLTQAVIAWIKLNRGQAERISTTGRVIDRTKIVTDCLGHRRTIGSVAWVPGTSTRGSADISATIAGRSVKIEIKVGRDKQRPDQKTYQQTVEAAGGLYFIASSFQKFYDWYLKTF